MREALVIIARGMLTNADGVEGIARSPNPIRVPANKVRKIAGMMRRQYECVPLVCIASNDTEQ
jgi:hypothetical protein